MDLSGEGGLDTSLDRGGRIGGVWAFLVEFVSADIRNAGSGGKGTTDREGDEGEGERRSEGGGASSRSTYSRLEGG